MSPDSKTLLVLTSGYNRVYNANGTACFGSPDSNEYVFIYDISTAHAGQEASSADSKYLQRDCLRSIRHGFLRVRGWGCALQADNVHIVTLSADGTWVERPGTELALGHRAGLGLAVPNGAISPDQQPGCRAALRRRRGYFE